MTPGRTSHPEEGIRDFCEVIQEDGGGRTPHFQTGAPMDLAKRQTGVAAVQPDNKLFACPDDRFYYAMPHGSNEYIAEPLHRTRPSFSSYTYNCGNLLLNSRTGQTNSPAI